MTVWRRRSLGAVALLLALGAAGGVWWRQADRTPIRTPPTLDLHDVDPAVAVAIEKERLQVLRTPRSASAWGKLAALLTAFNYRGEAMICFAEAERLDPSDVRWPYHRGVLLFLDDPNDAIPCLRRAVERGGDAEAPRLRLSEALLSLDRLDEAEEAFRLCRAQDHPRVRLGLGRIALQRERWDEARTHLEAAAKDRSSARAAALALAELHQRRGDDKTAADYRRRVELLPPDPAWSDPFVEEIQRFDLGRRIRLMRADGLFQRGHAAEAIARLHELVQDYPSSREAWFALGQCLHAVGDYPRAEVAMRKVVELDPGYAEAHNYLGAALLRQKRLEDAAVSLRKAIELKPDFALAYGNLGRCLLRQNDVFAAVSAFRSAVSCKPEYALAHTELAEALHQIHRDGEALEQARQALQLNAGDERAKQLRQKLEPTATSDKGHSARP